MAGSLKMCNKDMKMLKVLHLLTGGGIGGIEVLCREISQTDRFENGFAFLTFGGQIYDRMRLEGARVYPLFELGGKFSLKKLKRLIELAKEYDVLIVHHEDPFLEMYFCSTLRHVNIKGIRYVHSCYGDAGQKRGNIIKDIFNRITVQRSLDAADMVYYVSKAGRDSCRSLYRVKRNKERVIYNGISNKILEDGGEYFLRGKKTDSGEVISILYVGRLASIKGVDLLIRAFDRCRLKDKLKLVIVGDGEERMELEVLTKKLKISDLVSFEGFHTDVSTYMREADLFIYPSICEEVFGISIVEAMAFGILCIANRVGGIPEIIVDGENGFLTDETSVEGIERAILRAVKLIRSGNIENMRLKARKTAERFGINVCIENIGEALKEII